MFIDGCGWGLGIAAGLLVAGFPLAASRAGDWTGAYVAVGIGADAIRQKTVVDPVGQPIVDIESWLGGDLGTSMMLGYDQQIGGNFVVGVFGSYDWSAMETGISASTPGGGGKVQLFGLDHGLTLALRAGVKPTDDMLVYGLVGYSKVNFDDFAIQGGGTDLSFKFPAFHGIVVGGGIEERLSGNFSVRAEYRATLLQQEVLYESLLGTVTGEPALHEARLIAAYRFGDAAGIDGDTAAKLQPAWSGFRVGARAGLEASTRDLEISSADGAEQILLTGLGGGEFSGGVTAGYDLVVSPALLVGAFAAYDKALTRTTIDLASGSDSASIDLLGLDRMWTVGARAGLLAAPDLLLYGLAGYSHADFSDLRLKFSTPDLGTASGDFSFGLPSFSGYTLGLGFEKMLDPHWSLGGEYRFTRLNPQVIYADPAQGSISLAPDLEM